MFPYNRIFETLLVENSLREVSFKSHRYFVRKALAASTSLVCAMTFSSHVFAQTSVTTDQVTAGTIDSYTVPVGFTRVRITAKGGDGGTDTFRQAASGDGAIAVIKLDVSPSDIFTSVIGQSGEDGTTNDGGAGGGAGTGVCFNGSVVVVGGGGGGGDNTDNAGGGAQNGGNDSNNGRDGLSITNSTYAEGGNPANVAEAGIPSGTDVAAGAGGGGINGAGDNYTASAPLPGGISPGTAFGGEGADVTCSTVSLGGQGVETSGSHLGPGYDGGNGFGGGGGSWSRAAGGGGGYYGGGGAGNSGWAGGGGSYFDNTVIGFVSGNLTAGENLQNNGNDGYVEIVAYGQPVAVNDSATYDYGPAVPNALNVLADDMIANDTAITSNVTISLAAGSTVPVELSFDSVTGNISVNANTPVGTYSFDYEICNIIEPDICDIATATIVIEGNPSLSMTKIADNAGPHAVGDVVTYTYTITNDGEVIVRDITITDTHNGSDPAPTPGTETLLTDTAPTGDSTDAATNGSWDALAPGDVITFTGTYTVTQTDADNL